MSPKWRRNKKIAKAERMGSWISHQNSASNIYLSGKKLSFKIASAFLHEDALAILIRVPLTDAQHVNVAVVANSS